MKHFTLSIIILLLALSFSAAQIPQIKSHITDNAGILSPDKKADLETKLRGLEKATNGVQFVVYIEKSYPEEYSLEEYTLKIAEENKIGKKGNDNGILLYVAVDERKYRWEVGYGVESTLNSPLLGRISREYIIPSFKAGDYEKGIFDAVDVTSRTLLQTNDSDIGALKRDTSLEEYERISDSALSSLAKSLFIIMLLLWSLLIGTFFGLLICILTLILAETFGFIPVIMGSIIFFIITSIMKMHWLKKKRSHDDHYYIGAVGNLFSGSFGSGGFGRGGFSGGGGSFGGGGSSGGW